jgi:hypothetical protein
MCSSSTNYRLIIEILVKVSYTLAEIGEIFHKNIVLLKEPKKIWLSENLVGHFLNVRILRHSGKVGHHKHCE